MCYLITFLCDHRSYGTYLLVHYLFHNRFHNVYIIQYTYCINYILLLFIQFSLQTNLIPEYCEGQAPCNLENERGKTKEQTIFRSASDPESKFLWKS
jgi:uncharacterized sodium:solute symporter family permease YidK